jgi:acyl-coenzyme A thioesterase PaaI-like protein
MKFNNLWLNHLGEISSGCLLSIFDTGALPILLIFSTKQSTSVDLKLSMINPKLSGDYLYFTCSCVKQKTPFAQMNFIVRDNEKLIATGTHFKIFQSAEIPKI